MTKLTTEKKYAQREVVEFWTKLSQEGLQRGEQAMIQRYLPPAVHLLDAGCGAGRVALALSDSGHQVTGVDLSLAMLAAGRRLSAASRLGGANIIALPFADDSFEAVFMFFGALQHIPGRNNRRQALAEMARVTRPQGRLIISLDNIAPALICYAYWFAQKLLANQAAASPSPQSIADTTLWRRQAHPLLWHTHGLARTLRWRTWPGLVDLARKIKPCTNSVEPGDTYVAQFAVPTTPGRIYYHLYRAGELIEEAHQAGWRLLGYHSGSELKESRLYPAAVRRRDKQLFFAFRRERGGK